MLSTRHVLTKGFTVILVIVLPLPVEPTTFLRTHKLPVLLLRNSLFLMTIKKGGWCFFFFLGGGGHLKALASKWKGQEECKGKEPGGGHSGGSTPNFVSLNGEKHFRPLESTTEKASM